MPATAKAPPAAAAARRRQSRFLETNPRPRRALLEHGEQRRRIDQPAVPDRRLAPAEHAGEEPRARDGLGDLRAVMRERFGEKVRLKPVAVARPGRLARVLGRRGEPTIEDGSAGAGLIDPGAVIAALEERAAWARLGL